MEPVHPSLFFTAADLPALRERGASTLRPQLDALLAYAEPRLDDEPPSGLSGGYEKRGDQIQDPFLARILVFSTLAVITGEPRHVRAAKRWALALAHMMSWVGVLDPATGKCASCGYPEGWGVTALALAYDFLHPELDEEERAVLREKIAAVTSGLYHGSLAGEWWTGAYLHHDTWIPLGGLGVGAMAIVGEVPEAETWAERAREALGEALDWLDGDGAWPEGPCGWAFAMISAVPFWDAYRRRFPERAEAVLDNPWLQRTASFRIHSRAPDGRFVAFGDCNPHGGYQENAKQAAPTLRWLAARYRDPVAQWQAAREWETVPNPYTAAWEILWMDPSVPEEAPKELPHGALFENQGIAYLRTGWDRQATVLGFRCDSLLGRRAASLYRPEEEWRWNNSTTHVHADANGFGIWARGELAVTTARYGQNGTERQNSVLVDGEGQYTRFGADHLGRPDGRVTAFLASPFAGYVAGDAARAYPPGLSRFVRRMVLVRPGLVFLFDDLAAAAPVDVEWRFHVDAGASLQVGERGFVATSGGRATHLRLGEAASFIELGDDWNRGVTARTGDRRSEMALAAVIVPSVAAEEAPAIEGPTASSFVVRALGAEVLAAAGVGGTLSVPGRLSGRGAVAVVSGQGMFVAEASELRADGQALSASAPVTLAYHRDGDAGLLVAEAGGGAELALSSMGTVREVRRADGTSVPFAVTGGTLELRLPAGSSRLLVR